MLSPAKLRPPSGRFRHRRPYQGGGKQAGRTAVGPAFWTAAGSAAPRRFGFPRSGRRSQPKRRRRCGGKGGVAAPPQTGAERQLRPTVAGRAGSAGVLAGGFGRRPAARTDPGPGGPVNPQARTPALRGGSSGLRRIGACISPPKAAPGRREGGVGLVSWPNSTKSGREPVPTGREPVPKPRELLPGPPERLPMRWEPLPEPPERVPRAPEPLPKAWERLPTPAEPVPRPPEVLPKPRERVPAPSEPVPRGREQVPGWAEQVPKPAEAVP